MQYLIRPGLLYNVTDLFYIGAGYTYSVTHNHGELPGAKYIFPEHRMWEQFVLKSKIGRVELQQRARIEQQWIGETSADMDVTSYRYKNRMRYLLRANLPLSQSEMENGTLYLCASNEIMIGFDKNVGSNIYDQNRLFTGIGYQLLWGRIELGYMNQNLIQSKILYPASGSCGYLVFKNN